MTESVTRYVIEYMGDQYIKKNSTPHRIGLTRDIYQAKVFSNLGYAQRKLAQIKQAQGGQKISKMRAVPVEIAINRLAQLNGG